MFFLYFFLHRNFIRLMCYILRYVPFFLSLFTTSEYGEPFFRISCHVLVANTFKTCYCPFTFVNALLHHSTKELINSYVSSSSVGCKEITSKLLLPLCILFACRFYLTVHRAFSLFRVFFCQKLGNEADWENSILPFALLNCLCLSWPPVSVEKLLILIPFFFKLFSL